MASQYGGSSRGQYGGGSSSPFTNPIPKTSRVPAATHHHGHSILGNLLEDAINTAKGLPFGLKQFAEHPIRATEEAAKLTAHEYAPLVHGHWGEFYAGFKAHPLGPLLDAISVPAMLVGGLGVGIKGASALTDIGRVAELGTAGRGAEVEAQLGRVGHLGELSRNPALARTAARFKSGTEFTTKTHATSVPGYEVVQNYSKNMFSRFLQKSYGATSHQIADLMHVPQSARKGARLEQHAISRRQVAASYAARQQVRAGVGAAKKGASVEDIHNAISNSMERTFEEGLIPVNASEAQDLMARGNYAYARELRSGEGTQPGHQEMLDLGEAGYKGAEGGFKKSPIWLKGTSNQDIAEYVKALGGRYKGTSLVREAARDEHGNLLMFRQSIPQEINNELEGTSQLAKKIGKSPTTIWKYLILAQAPRYFVNNVVGNTTMLAAATHPVALTHGILDAIRSTRGDAAATAAEKEMRTIAEKEVDKYLPRDVVSDRYGFLHHTATGLDYLPKSKLQKVGRQGLYDITGTVAYSATQRAGLMAALRGQESVRRLTELYKSQGLDKYAAFQKAAREASKNPKVMGAVEKQVTDWAGQYYHLNSFERLITALVPFYNWDRHALRFAKTTVLERPVQAAVFNRLGSEGDTEADKILGKIPDFMKGAIPVKGHAGGVLGFVLGQGLPGRQKIVLTAGLNPLSAASEDVHALAALVGARSPGEAVGGQLNPLISGAISGVTGQRLFSGSKVHHRGGVLGSSFAETFGELPQVKIIKNLEGGNKPPVTKAGKPTLYAKNQRQLISSFLGLSERDFSPAAAKALYDKQKGVHKGRRHAKKFAWKVGSNAKANLNY
jgi:hypothetical protein